MKKYPEKSHKEAHDKTRKQTNESFYDKTSEVIEKAVASK